MLLWTTASLVWLCAIGSQLKEAHPEPLDGRELIADAAASQSVGMPLPYPLYWLHAPRTGSTFGGVIAAALCEGLDDVRGVFHSLRTTPDAPIWGRGVTFRYVHGTMVPFGNATTAQLVSGTWLRELARPCQLRRGFAVHAGGAQPPKFSLDEETAGGFAHGHRAPAGPDESRRPLIALIREPSGLMVSMYKQGIKSMCAAQARGEPCLSKASRESRPKDLAPRDSKP